MTPYRVLVTGSREWVDREFLEDVLSNTLSASCPLVVVHGACPKGADIMAARWVEAVRGENFAVIGEPYPADWERLGKAAGRGRNQQMVDKGADVCYAFYREGRSNAGTADCAARAEAAGIPVRRFCR